MPYIKKTGMALCMFALLIVPLVFWHGVFFPYTFIKTILFYIVTELTFAIGIALAIADKEYHPRISAVTGAWILFLVSMGIASFTGVSVSKSIWSDYERMFGFVTWLHVGAFFFVLSSVVQKDAEWRMVWKIIISTGAVVALIAVWQGFTASDLSISTIGNAAYLSSYIVPMFFLVGMFVLQEERFTKRVWLLYIGLLLLFLGALIFTQARAGIVGFLGGGGVSALLFLFFGNSGEFTWGLSNRSLKKYIAIVVLLTLVLIGSIIFLFSDSAFHLPGPFRGLLDFSWQNRTTTGRFLVWDIAWEGWKEKLVFGWGPENFAILFNTYYKPELYAVEPWFDRAHNFIFDTGTTMGIVGLLAYFSIFGAAIFMLVRKWRRGAIPFWHMAMLVSLLAAHLLQNLFTFDTLSALLVIGVVIGYSNARSVGEYDKSVPDTRNTTNMRHVFAVSVVSVFIAGVVGYITVARPFFANAAAHRGWELLRTGGGDETAIAEFERSISYGTRYSVDARRFMAEYVFEFLKQSGRRPDVSMARLIEYAIEKMTENMAEEPENVKWVMYRGELYSLMAQKFNVSFAKKAEEDFLHARDMSPGRPQIYLELAQARKLQGDANAAWEYIDQVVYSVPDFSFGHLNALILAIETGKTAREEQELEWLAAGDELRVEAIRDAYFKQRRYRDAALIQEEIVRSADQELETHSPRNRAALYAHLAALYQLAGDGEHAREAAMVVLTLDPTQKNEVEVFLQSLQ